MAGIDVLVVTHRAGALLDRCLGALSAQHTAPRRTLVVVSSDVSVTVPPGVDVLRTDGPSDFAPAANLGLSVMGERPVVLLNDDTTPHPLFIAELERAVDSPGIYQPRILLPDGRIDNTGHWLFWDGFNVARGRGTHTTNLPDRAGAFSGAAVCFTPEVLETVGLFDAEFGAYGEDLDLSLRAVRMGFPIRYVPAAEVTHELGATYGRTTPKKIYRVERNRTQAAIRSLPAAAVLAMPATATVRWAIMGVAAARGQGLGQSAGIRGALAAVAGAVSGAAAAPAALSKRRRDRGQWTVDDAGMWRHLWRQCAPLGKLSGEGLSER